MAAAKPTDDVVATLARLAGAAPAVDAVLHPVAVAGLFLAGVPVGFTGDDDAGLDADPDRRVIVVCNEGFSSSLAAHTLQGLGLPHATDLAGGYQA